jgi:hypothetical protein
MTEKGYKSGLVSRVRNKNSGKKYVISTAQEIGQDYWTTTVFPAILFGFLPSLSKKIFTIVRNNMEAAHETHWSIKELILNSSENEWFEKMPNPEPPEGWSTDAKKKFRERGIE